MTENGALVDLSGHLGGWVSIIGYVFSLLALATSFWANTLNLRDIVNEQTKWGEKISWLVATLPCLVIALVGVNGKCGPGSDRSRSDCCIQSFQKTCGNQPDLWKAWKPAVSDISSSSVVGSICRSSAYGDSVKLQTYYYKS